MPIGIALILVAANTEAGPGDEWRVNWARAEQGARLVAAPEAHPATGIGNLLMEPVDGPRRGNGHTIFADKVQGERLVVDLGQPRRVGRVFIGSLPGDVERNPETVTIRGATESATGPWQTLVDRGDMRLQHTFAFADAEVRYLEVDLGESTDSRGSRITSFGVFTRLALPEATTIVQWLAGKYDRGATGLDGFFRAADGEQWDQAVRELRGYYAARFQPREGDASERSKGIAADLLTHRFEFGQPVHQFGPRVEDIDWAYQLDYEWTNDLNRCGNWTHTAIVYQATGDTRYIEEVEAQLLHWIESCPLPPKPAEGRWRTWQGWDDPARITWRSLDSAIRLWKLCELLPLFCADRDHVSDRACMALLYSIWEHIDYLSDDDWDGGNWLSTVNASVLDAAVAHGEFADSGDWLAYSSKAFETNVLRDVRADGKEVENSTGYIQFAYQSLFRVLKTLTERRIEVDPEAHRRLDLLQDFMAWTAFPDGTIPMIGDSDSGGIGMLEQTWPFFGRDDIRYILTGGQEGTVPAQSSRYWPDSGWCVMRSEWGDDFRDAVHLVFKASPQGPHGHLDQNSLTLYAYGRPLLIDPGRMNYRAEGVTFRSTPYHNTVTVDDADQAEGSATFERWESTAEYDLAVGSHELYRGVTHRRQLCFAKPGFFVVRDDVTSEEEHRYIARWHFPEGAMPEQLEGGRVTTRFAEGANLLIVPLGEIAASHIEDYSVAYRWDERIDAQGWAYELSGPTLVTLLIPYRGATVPDVIVTEAMVGADELRLELSLDGAEWRVGIGDETEVRH